jgi:Sporulation and spore germination
VQSGDFEATVGYGVGLAKKQPFHLFTLSNPSRVVVDVAKDYKETTRRVWLLDSNRFNAGTPPYTRTVKRHVPAAAPAGAVLHQLFAGPTPAESARGLRTVRSGATGFTGPTIHQRIATLRLTGGCSSGGSTFTVADLVRPTLKQFRTVRWVKIKDTAGQTEHPTGRRDSVPECLEP